MRWRFVPCGRLSFFNSLELKDLVSPHRWAQEEHARSASHLQTHTPYALPSHALPPGTGERCAVGGKQNEPGSLGCFARWGFLELIECRVPRQPGPVISPPPLDMCRAVGAMTREMGTMHPQVDSPCLAVNHPDLPWEQLYRSQGRADAWCLMPEAERLRERLKEVENRQVLQEDHHDAQHNTQHRHVFATGPNKRDDAAHNGQKT